MVIYRKRGRSDSWRRVDYSINRKSTCQEPFLLWYLWNRAQLPYNTRQAPVHLPPPCCFKIFITLFDALGDRSCLINRWCIPFLESWLPFLDTLFEKNFMMLSLALVTKMFCFKTKVMLQLVGMFSKKCDGESIRALMGSTSEKMYLYQVPNFGF